MGARNKTAELARSLTEEEAEAFGRSAPVRDRPSLGRLFRALRRTAAPDKAALYRAVFRAPYAPEEDYRLRHEQRLLGEALARFAADAVRDAAWRDGQAAARLDYLAWLRARGLYDLLEREGRKWGARAEAGEDPATAARILQWRVEAAIAGREARSDTYRELIDRLDALLGQVRLAAEQGTHYAQHKRAFAERTLEAIEGDARAWRPEPWTLAPDRPAGTAYAEYLRLLTEAYALRGAPRVAHLERARALVPEVPERLLPRRLSAATLEASLALEHFLQGDFPRALAHHRASLAHPADLPASQAMAFRFNLASTLMRMERYGEAIEALAPHRDAWMAMPRFRDRCRCLLAMAHALRGEADAMRAVLPERLKDGGTDHYFYYRYLQVILACLDGETLLALNEAENFADTLRYRDGDPRYRRLVRTTRRALRFGLERPAMDRAQADAARTGLLGELDAEGWLREAPDMALLARWLHAWLMAA